MEHVKPWFVIVRCNNRCCPPVQAGPFTSKEQGEQWAEEICDKSDLMLSNVTMEQHSAFTDEELFEVIMKMAKQELAQLVTHQTIDDVLSAITGTPRPDKTPDTDKIVSIVQAVMIGYISNYRPGCTIEDIKQAMITAYQEDKIGETVGGVQ